MTRPAAACSARPALCKAAPEAPVGKAQGGFSFIEILIVMGIISVLVGGVVVAIGMWAEKGPQFQTKNTLTKVKVLVENWKTWSNFDVPGDVTKIAGLVGSGDPVPPPENQINAGIESVYQALYWPGFKGDPAWDEETELSNIDEDKLRKAVNKLGTTDLMEIKDGWGNPLIYFHNADYKKFSGSGQTYSSQTMGEVEARPWQREDGTFYNPLGFQIFSMGPDGEPNTEDDVTTWTKGD